VIQLCARQEGNEEGRNTEELIEGRKVKGEREITRGRKNECYEHLREDGKERDDEENINRHTSAPRIQWSMRRGETWQENGGKVEDDFGPSELTVETLYGEWETDWER